MAGNSFEPFLNAHMETMPREDIERLQEARLMRRLALAYERAGLIRQIWDAAGLKPSDIRSMEDFRQKAPFFDKDAIRNYRDVHDDPYGGLKVVDDVDIKMVGTTGGTTGDPTPLPYGLQNEIDLTAARDNWHIGVRPGDYVAMLGGAYRQSHLRWAAHQHDFIPLMFNNQPSELPRFIEGCKRFQPVSIAVLNNPLLGALEQLFERTGTDPKDAFGSMKGALFGGEVLSPRQRALAAGWGIELFEMTSLGDICNSIDCRAHDGFHAWEDMVLVECLEPGGNTSMPDGEIGELVVTSLRSSFMPMIRFRTDDLVTLNRAPCACGRTHVRFKVLGRAGDSMVVGDRRVLPRDVQAIVETHGETRRGLFQIIRTGPQADVLRLRVGYDPDQLSDSTDSLAGRLRAELAEWLGAPVELEMVLDAELLKLGPPHKIPRVAKS